MVNYKFIEQLEGYSCKGYVPDPENSQSGVTIACGFDIGQRSVTEILQVFSSDLTNKLIPYSGLKKNDAVIALQKLPLVITTEEAHEINQYCQNNAINKLAQRWQASESSVVFSELSSQCQTVVASVAFQYGDLKSRTPNFWHQITHGKWEDALENLRNFSDKYPNRRNREADLLQSWLDR